MNLTGAKIVLECLLEQGVDTVFGYPGGSVLNLYDALHEYSDKVTHILTAHEQGASHAADGYARASGKTGVCIATSGPGATNLVTGIATAYMDSVPLVAITGNVPVALLGLDSFQEVDITGVTMPVTKHNFIVKDVTKLADVIRRAFYIANEGRKGPVLVDIPKDILSATCNYHKALPQPIDRNHTVATAEQIEAVVTLLEKSKKPFIYTGGGVISAEATAELAAFVGRLDAPVASSLMGQGAFDNTNARYMGMLGMHGSKTSSLAVTECDVFLGIGTRFSDRVIGDIRSFAPAAQIVHIDIDPAEINKNIKVDYELLGDLRFLLQKLTTKIIAGKHQDWMAQVQLWKETYPMVMAGTEADNLLPQDILERLNDLTDGNAIFTTEVGQHQMWAAQFLNIQHPRHFISSGGLGTMGFGLGAAMGAAFAHPDKKVVNIAGDGCFQMNCNELSTLHKYNIPIVELLFNNNTLGMVRQWQTMFYGKRYASTTLDLGINYEKLAEAYGIHYDRIACKQQIEPVLTKALSHDGPILIECMIDKDLLVLPMVPAGGSVSNPILKIEQ